MPALSGGDRALWISQPYNYVGYLYIDKPPLIFQARVNGATSFPIADVPYHNVTTGAYTDIQTGMLVVFESSPGADDLGRTIVRRAATSSLLKIARCSAGTDDGECAAVDGSYISIYDTYPLYAKIPFIDANGTIYKFWDFDFATYGTNQGCVVNMGGGPGWITYLDANTSVGTFSSNVITAGSYGVDGNISTFLWNVADGTITSGSTTTAGITATFPPGRRYISVAITDTNGITSLRRMFIVVLKDGTAFTPLTNIQVTQQTFTRSGGQRFSVRIKDSIPRSTYLDGSMVIYWEREFYGNTEAVLNNLNGFNHIKFCGWNQTQPIAIRAKKEGFTTETVLNCLDPIGKLDTLPGFSQELNRVSSPTTWFQAKSLNMDKYFVILLRWHSTLLELTDFKGMNKGDIYGVSRLGSDGASIYKQVEHLADNAVGYHFVCDPQGRTSVVPDQNLLNTSSRTSTAIVSVTEDDYSDISFTFQRPPKVYWERGAAILASTADVTADMPATAFVISPGSAPSQGVSANDRSEQLVLDEPELMIRTGNRYARNNSDYSQLKLKVVHPGDCGVYPSVGQWVDVTLGATYAAQQGLTFTNKRFIPIDVDIQHTANAQKGNTKNVTWTLEIETSGLPSLDDTPPVDPNPPSTPQPSVDPTPNGNLTPNVGDGSTAIAMDRNLSFRITTTSGATWTTVSYTGFTDGTIYDAELDPRSPYFTTNGAGALNIYLVGPSGLWYGTDILNAGVYTLKLAPPSHIYFGNVRPDITAIDGGVVSFCTDSPFDAYLKRFTNHGASVSWTRQMSLDIPGYADHEIYFDINQNGVDEAIISTVADGLLSGQTSNGLWRVLNGNLPVNINKGVGPLQLRRGTIQRPIKVPSGGLNSSVSSSEYLIWSNNALYKTTNGGTTQVDITPSLPNLSDWQGHFPFAPSDNGGVLLIASSEVAGSMFLSYSTTVGASYTTSAAAPPSNGPIRTEILKTTTGYRVYFVNSATGGTPNGILATIDVIDLTMWTVWNNSWGNSGGGYFFFMPLG